MTAPILFTTEGDLRTWLNETINDAPHSHFLRDAYDRPWIVTWGEDDLFVVSYTMPAAATWHGDLDLPTYPVRLIKES